MDILKHSAYRFLFFNILLFILVVTQVAPVIADIDSTVRQAAIITARQVFLDADNSDIIVRHRMVVSRILAMRDVAENYARDAQNDLSRHFSTARRVGRDAAIADYNKYTKELDQEMDRLHSNQFKVARYWLKNDPKYYGHYLLIKKYFPFFMIPAREDNVLQMFGLNDPMNYTAEALLFGAMYGKSLLNHAQELAKSGNKDTAYAISTAVEIVSKNDPEILKDALALQGKLKRDVMSKEITRLRREAKKARKAKNNVLELEILTRLHNIFPDDKRITDRISAIQVELTRETNEEEIRNLMTVARSAYADKSYKRALSALEKILRIDPNHKDANKLRRRAKNDLKDAETASQLVRMKKLEKDKNWMGALSAAEKILLINPNHRHAKKSKKRYLAKIEMVHNKMVSMFTGSWKGFYKCGSNYRGLHLNIEVKKPDTLQAVFNFYPLNKQSKLQAGSFSMRGVYKLDGTFRLQPEAWLKRPRGYVMAGMAGRVSEDQKTMAGNIGFRDCTTFELKKSSKSSF